LFKARRVSKPPTSKRVNSCLRCSKKPATKVAGFLFALPGGRGKQVNAKIAFLVFPFSRLRGKVG